MNPKPDNIEALRRELAEIKETLAHRKEVSKLQTELIDHYYKQAFIDKKRVANLFVIFPS